jgi:hypothetical protein
MICWFLAYFSYFKIKIKDGLWDHLVVWLCINLCSSVSVSPVIFGDYGIALLSVSQLELFFLGLRSHLACVSVCLPPIFFVFMGSVSQAISSSLNLLYYMKIRHLSSFPYVWLLYCCSSLLYYIRHSVHYMLRPQKAIISYINYII